MLMFATVLLACQSASSAPGDSADVPPCELAHPWEMGTAEDVELAAVSSTTSVALMLFLAGDVATSAEWVVELGESCPTVTESTEGSTEIETVTGDCTTEWGYVFAGSATFTSVETDYGWDFTDSYSDFTFDDRGVQGRYAFTADGEWALSDAPDGPNADLDLTLTVYGDLSFTDTTATFNTSGLYEDLGWNAGSVDILSQPSSTATGDLCLDDQWQWTDACDIEPDGVETLWGTRRATLTWDGSTACDGCAKVAIDGVDLGTYCP